MASVSMAVLDTGDLARRARAAGLDLEPHILLRFSTMARMRCDNHLVDDSPSVDSFLTPALRALPSAPLPQLQSRASAGDPAAQLQLGDCLMYGLKGCPRDSRRACELYRRAAEQWLPEALVQCAVLTHMRLTGDAGDRFETLPLEPSMALSPLYAQVKDLLGAAAERGHVSPFLLHWGEQARRSCGLREGPLIHALDERYTEYLQELRQRLAQERGRGQAPPGGALERDLEAAEQQKELGNARFAAGDPAGAAALYAPAIQWLGALPEARRAQPRLRLVHAALLSNRAECRLRPQDFPAALNDAKEAVALLLLLLLPQSSNPPADLLRKSMLRANRAAELMAGPGAAVELPYPEAALEQLGGLRLQEAVEVHAPDPSPASAPSAAPQPSAIPAPAPPAAAVSEPPGVRSAPPPTAAPAPSAAAQSRRSRSSRRRTAARTTASPRNLARQQAGMVSPPEDEDEVCCMCTEGAKGGEDGGQPWTLVGCSNAHKMHCWCLAALRKDSRERGRPLLCPLCRDPL